MTIRRTVILRRSWTLHGSSVEVAALSGDRAWWLGSASVHPLPDCWPTTGSGNDLRIGSNKRRPLVFPPRYLKGASISGRAFPWSPVAQPHHLCLGGRIVRIDPGDLELEGRDHRALDRSPWSGRAVACDGGRVGQCVNGRMVVGRNAPSATALDRQSGEPDRQGGFRYRGIRYARSSRRYPGIVSFLLAVLEI